MKMVKSLLLGTAAGLVAMTGAQAADLPVKAKPVQYVKICSLYGAGFYYIPGTDTCIKVGGWVRMQMGYGYNGNSTNGPMATNSSNRSTTDFMTRNRGYITADARSQTEYGTLRSYIAVGLTGDNASNAVATTNVTTSSAFNANRAFIQFAGFTAGRASSFYDFMSYAAVAYHGGSVWTPGGADTGDGGKQVLAYTAQLGNGISATLSAEDKRRGMTRQALTSSTLVVDTVLLGSVGDKMPDFVGSMRIDQAWGSTQVMGAVHDASAMYYSTAASHPANIYGYAIGAGLRLNAPMLGAGDYFQAQFNWTKGAIGYAMLAGTSLSKTNGGESGFGLVTDGIVSAVAGDSVQLTTAWSVGASYEHNWNSKWKTSAYGGYTDVNYNATATALFSALTAGANPDFSTWQIGSRTAWAPVTNLEVGVDVMYTKLKSANSGTAATSQDQSAWVSQLRVQRNFYP